MRTRLGWVLAGLGVVCAALGLAVMVVLGPDGRLTTGPHPVETDRAVVVTAPKALTWRGVRFEVLAELPAGKPVFVGLGNSVDVHDFVGGTARLEVSSFQAPWTYRVRVAEGVVGLPASPTAVDWWIAEAAGLGGARLSATLPDETVSVVITSVGSSDLEGLAVSVAYGVEGGFLGGAGMALIGLGGAWAGLLLRRGTDEAIAYVLVDEDKGQR